jgi:hypothetical protein
MPMVSVLPTFHVTLIKLVPHVQSVLTWLSDNVSHAMEDKTVELVTILILINVLHALEDSS